MSCQPCRADDTVYVVAMNAMSGLYSSKVKITAPMIRQGEARWGNSIKKFGKEFIKEGFNKSDMGGRTNDRF